MKSDKRIENNVMLKADNEIQIRNQLCINKKMCYFMKKEIKYVIIKTTKVKNKLEKLLLN